MSPKADDLVDMVFVTVHNFFYTWNVERSFATNIIRAWFTAREHVRGGGKEAEDAKEWLSKGTFALNEEGEDGQSFANWAVGWEYLIGIYTRELYQRDPKTSEKVLKIQEEMMEIQLKEMKKHAKSEDWKEEEE